jgi:uncharacterized membrane protein required for colicin V production
VTLLDVGALVVIGLTALAGFRRGLVVGACSLGGLALGAYTGAKIAPHILRGDASVYPPLVALAGGVVGAGIGQWLAVTAGRSLRELLRIGLLRAFDNVGGAVLGAATGFLFVWFIGSIMLYAPGDSSLRRAVQRSHIAGSLTGALPPARIIDVLTRIDPFDALAGPGPNVGPGDPGLLDDPQVRVAGRSILRVIGNACGLGIEGSGWIAAPGYVVTNAHVVAGVRHPYVDRYGGTSSRAVVVAFNPRDDLAVLRVPGLQGRALPAAIPEKGTAVVVLGYPDDRPLHGVAGRLGETVPTFVRDAYGRFPVARTVTPIRAEIRPGNSGGPAVDADGRVRAIVFARRAGSQGGFAVPVQLVSSMLVEARRGEEIRSACAES